MKTGLELILEERRRQIEKEGYNTEHDSHHEDGSIAMAAACYAAPKEIYEVRVRNNQTILFEDPFPWGEETFGRGERGWKYSNTKEKKAGKSRIRQLQIAGALIAAEIDRLQEVKKPA